MVPLEVVGVRVEIPANTPMVLLRETTGKQRYRVYCADEILKLLDQPLTPGP